MTDEARPSRENDAPRNREIVRHIAFALCGHVRRLRQEGQFVPSEVMERAAFLSGLVSVRRDAPAAAKERPMLHDAAVPERLLVTKGEAAQRLCVSVRTIERLVATGRLRQVHVERWARFRIRDLEAYVDGLDEGAGTDIGSDFAVQFL